MSSFGIYIIGAIILIAGLSYGAVTLGIPPVFIGIGALIILGLAIMGGVNKTRQKDETPASE